MNKPSPFDNAAVIIAATHRTSNLGARLAQFAAELGPGDALILVDGSGDPDLLVPSNVRLVLSPPGSLAPELWRDGLLATDAPLVALTTAQMVPRSGWLSSLKARLHATQAAGVGGPIEPGSSLSSTDRAVALLRYSRYFPPVGTIEPPGDNALYRRDRLVDVSSTWVDGFWEVEVHQALRDLGHQLTIDESAIVTFKGGLPLSAMIRQRLSHARRYGHLRSRGSSKGARLTQLALTPLVPPLLCARILVELRSRQIRLPPWITASLPLTLLATAWAAGQAWGTLSSRTDRQSPASRSQPITLETGKV